ncbi:hypothetical protein WJ977_19860 [Achromobacter xylosoxidans]
MSRALASGPASSRSSHSKTLMPLASMNPRCTWMVSVAPAGRASTWQS